LQFATGASARILDVPWQARRMGITERRAREREQRQSEILRAAWLVAEDGGWVTFSVERVAARAELGRATIYSYFESLESLVIAMSRDALERLSERVKAAPGLPEALDVPVRFAEGDPAAFALLFPPARDPRPQFSNPAVTDVQAEARKLLGRLQRLALTSGATLPEDAQSAAAFISGISMAGAIIPELRSSTPLRRQWQDFCLKVAVSPSTAGDVATPPATTDD
jgi:AcrR family transcriptional regulator